MVTESVEYRQFYSRRFRKREGAVVLLRFVGMGKVNIFFKFEL